MGTVDDWGSQRRSTRFRDHTHTGFFVDFLNPRNQPYFCYDFCSKNTWSFQLWGPSISKLSSIITHKLNPAKFFADVRWIAMQKMQVIGHHSSSLCSVSFFDSIKKPDFLVSHNKQVSPPTSNFMAKNKK